MCSSKFYLGALPCCGALLWCLAVLGPISVRLVNLESVSVQCLILGTWVRRYLTTSMLLQVQTVQFQNLGL